MYMDLQSGKEGMDGNIGWGLCFADAAVVGDVLDELAGAALIVDAAAEMLHPIAYYEPLHFQLDVVAAYLLEDSLGNLYAGRFVLHNHQRFGARAIHYTIATLPGAVECNRHLVPDALGRIALIYNKVVDELLANPFFGRQRHIFPPQNVENMWLPVLCDNF